jgi:DNA-directed RNA polymerase specialized sigma24 family protein
LYQAIAFNVNNRRPETLVAAVPDRAARGGEWKSDDLRVKVGKFIDSLPRANREVLTLYLDGHSYREIAEHTMIGEAILRKRIQRLKQQCKAYLES